MEWLSIKLAFRNLLGSGKRTWLNVTVLSIAFVVIVFYNGLLDGWNLQAKRDTKAWETGSGRIDHALYDQFDPLSLVDAHAPLGEMLKAEIESGEAVAVLAVQASAYPNGRMVNVLLKGIDPAQKRLSLPTAALDSAREADGSAIPVIVGDRTAKSAKLKEGDVMIVRWRDVNGTFDAREVRIAGIFKTTVPTVDGGQLWMPLEDLREMTSLYGEATYVVLSDEIVASYDFGSAGALSQEWRYMDEDALMKEIDDIIKTKRASSMIMSMLLLGIALLAIFDTQILSIFRRQKEIGTYIALGMTRLRVVGIFTIEGTVHSILAILLGLLWGMPLLKLIQHVGLPMPAGTDQVGLAIADKIVPAYSAGMILASVLLVVISSFIVSYIPARKIAKMKPTEALRGKLL